MTDILSRCALTFFSTDSYSNLARIVSAQLAWWPEHAGFLAKRFKDCSDDHLQMADVLSGLVLRLAGDHLGKLCEDYRWHCSCLMPEQLHFERTGSYRLSSFAEAITEVYSNADYMRRYMNALLLTQILWSNHTEAINFYCKRFLETNTGNYRHLEIGPGHGLLLYFAALDNRAVALEAWDVSDTSLTMTSEFLARLDIHRHVAVHQRDILTATPDAVWDSVVISEVLEHLENPGFALATVRQCLRPGGRAFINVPVNCPAPDHIFLFSTPEDVIKQVCDAGLDAIEVGIFPSTGYTEMRARKLKAALSCSIIAQRPNQ